MSHDMHLRHPTKHQFNGMTHWRKAMDAANDDYKKRIKKALGL